MRAAVPMAAGLLAASTLVAGPALADQVAPIEGTPATPAEPAAVQPTEQVAVMAAGELTTPAVEQVPAADPATLRRLARLGRERRLRAAVVALARKQVGDRYVAGRTGPDAFDCSGLVRYVMGRVLGEWLPHYSRTQYRMVRRIPMAQARPGDLVFYFRHGAHHVGIYLGQGRMVHAANPRAGVRVGPIHGPWYSQSFTGIGRLIPAA